MVSKLSVPAYSKFGNVIKVFEKLFVLWCADENNPLNDYPDEDDFGGFGDEKSDSDDSDDSGDLDPYASDDEEYDTVAYDNEQDLRWQRRLWESPGPLWWS